MQKNLVLSCVAQALAAGLQADIPAMVKGLLDLGLEVSVDTEDLMKKDLLC